MLSLGEMEGALTKAIDSGDTDLVYLALFRSHTLHALSSFFHTCLVLNQLIFHSLVPVCMSDWLQLCTTPSEWCTLELQRVSSTDSLAYSAGVPSRSHPVHQEAVCSKKFLGQLFVTSEAQSHCLGSSAAWQMLKSCLAVQAYTIGMLWQVHMYMMVCRMYRKGMPLKTFLETINAKPLAKRLFMTYCHRRVGHSF